MQQDLSKTSYNNREKSVNSFIRFSSKKSYLDLSIFIDKKDPIIE